MPKKRPWDIPSRGLKLTEVGLQKISECKQRPSRRVGGGRNNTCARFPSQKMGVVIQAESRGLEYPCLLAMEKDSNVVEYYDQPFKIKVTYQGKDGRKRSHLETPDFYTRIAGDRHCIIECKPLKVLEEKGSACPTRYRKDADGSWISPAGIEAAASLGCEYLLFTEDHVSNVLTRNIKFLLDYMLPSAGEAYASRVSEIQKYVKEYGSIQLSELIAATGDADAIYYTILQGKVVFLLEDELLVYPEVAWVHVDQAHAELHCELKCDPQLAWKPTPCRIGDVYEWRQVRWRVVNLDQDKVDLINEKGDLISPFLGRVKQSIVDGDMKLLERIDQSGPLLEKVASRDIDVALYRLRWVRWHFDRSLPVPVAIEGDVPSGRSRRRWAASFIKAGSELGNGVLGLLPQTAKRGNRRPRLDRQTTELINESIQKDFNNAEAPSGLRAYGDYKKRVAQKGCDQVCYETYLKTIKSQDRKKSEVARFGWKAGYQLEHPVGTDTGVPVHGDRPWEVVHIDHTLLDILVVSALFKKILGRIWLTLMVDACSGKSLAFVLSFERPSYRAIMRVIRDCVRRHGRLPDTIVSDQGSEFNSRYYEKLLGFFGVTKLERAASNARQGGPVENAFGKHTISIIHSLPGNIKANKHGRAADRKTHAPEKHASLTLGDLHEILEEHLFETHPNQISRGIKETPNERYERLIEHSGSRDFKKIAYDDNFIFMTLPQPKQPTRKLKTGKPFEVRHIPYYGEILSHPEIDGLNAPVRYDPDDVSYSIVEVDHKSHRVKTTDRLFREYAERGILFPHDEITALGRLTAAEKRAAMNSIENYSSKDHLEPSSSHKESDKSDTSAQPYSANQDSTEVYAEDIEWVPAKVRFGD